MVCRMEEVPPGGRKFLDLGPAASHITHSQQSQYFHTEI